MKGIMRKSEKLFVGGTLPVAALILLSYIPNKGAFLLAGLIASMWGGWVVGYVTEQTLEKIGWSPIRSFVTILYLALIAYYCLFFGLIFLVSPR